ncbi:hypothetical protein E1265_18745 [Streptomyces sp. 8K308]|uniref:hypothetical protein n=1 Tax=Streptomyces sp. 8K308 TaxID=2530388 RepID=UPI001046EEE1|nr:hypothetical protein [Streptomyces sp. 8K308]TDC21191.1 hypothetical protein E1265_18745 [Streptomyces sp. 8K308]
MSTRKDEASRPLWKRRIGLTAAIATAAMASMVAASPSFAEPAADDVPRTEQELIDTLTGLLPGDLQITESYATGLEEGPDSSVSLIADDGAGGVSLDLSAYRWATEDWHDIAGCQGFGEPEEGFTCEDTTLEDGSILSLITRDYQEEGDPEEGIEPYQGRDWEVWLEGPGGSDLEQPGGRAIVLTESKDLTDAADPDAYTPPLDLDQLAEVVQAPVWQSVLDAADAEYGGPEEWEEEVPDSSDIPASDLRDTFRALAPEGLEIVDVETEGAGYGSVTVDDGQGPGLVDITAYEAAPEGEEGGESEQSISIEEAELIAEEDEAVDGPDCQDTTLEDGTVVSVCNWPASEDDPIAMNWAVVTYPDGSSLDITAYNVANWDAEPTRADAPFTGEQLAEIATADEWRALFG